ncbi:MAG: hypothetical protein RIT27_2254 [Pseudomonadota bacterium]|jgi:hypothetical protein
MARKIIGVAILCTLSFVKAEEHEEHEEHHKSPFEPNINVILEGRYAYFKNDLNNYHLAGFPETYYSLSGQENTLGEKGFSLGHSEIILSSNVGDDFYGQLTTALHVDEGKTTLEVEEAFAKTLNKAYNLTAKMGRFYSKIGYLNQQHKHHWDFADEPLIYRGLFANQYTDDGLQIEARLPIGFDMNVGGELLKGGHFPSAGEHDGVGAYTLFAKIGEHFNEENHWQAGLSYWKSNNIQQRPLIMGFSFSGKTQLIGANIVWKYTPSPHSKQQHFIFQTELFEQRNDGYYGEETSHAFYKQTHRGGYFQTIYQFLPRWRIGMRYDWVQSSYTDNGLPRQCCVIGTETGQRASIMLDWSNHKHYRFRLQFNRDRSYSEPDNQLFLQYIYSFGSHAAHSSEHF